MVNGGFGCSKTINPAETTPDEPGEGVGKLAIGGDVFALVGVALFEAQAS